MKILLKYYLYDENMENFTYHCVFIVDIIYIRKKI